MSTRWKQVLPGVPLSQLWEVALYGVIIYSHTLGMAGYLADSLFSAERGQATEPVPLDATRLPRPPACLGSWPIQCQQWPGSLMCSSSEPFPVTGHCDVSGPPR